MIPTYLWHTIGEIAIEVADHNVKKNFCFPDLKAYAYWEINSIIRHAWNMHRLKLRWKYANDPNRKVGQL